MQVPHTSSYVLHEFFRAQFDVGEMYKLGFREQHCARLSEAMSGFKKLFPTPFADDLTGYQRYISTCRSRGSWI